ncbi:MAG TPA: PRC-barrel domain containing protein [Sphingomicrobium sp.]|nr:PRC-barrel domain containing protein [Sphingomicrobium sp.]
MEQIASIAAPVCTTIAALIVASNVGARITGYGFIVFTLGSVAWAVLGLMTGQPNLLWQNVVLTGLNLFGIWRWLGRQARIEEGAAAAAQESRAEPGEDLFPVSMLAKAAVISSDGKEVGKCVDAMAGCRSGRLDYLVMSEGGVGGVGETLRRIAWADCRVEREEVRSALAASQFPSLQEVDPDRWPAR